MGTFIHTICPEAMAAAFFRIYSGRRSIRAQSLARVSRFIRPLGGVSLMSASKMFSNFSESMILRYATLLWRCHCLRFNVGSSLTAADTDIGFLESCTLRRILSWWSREVWGWLERTRVWRTGPGAARGIEGGMGPIVGCGG